MKKEKIGVKEAAKILGLSKKSVYTKLRSGQIPGEKINTKYGQKWVINKEQLEDQAKENEIVEVKEVNKPVSKQGFKECRIK
ncbi:MAG: helix-turn-helix domain-containing protein [Halanaerobiales bacterium]|nr:helix-turn-helix domain-containing protein [Halanaerobiales bacterium]